MILALTACGSAAEDGDAGGSGNATGGAAAATGGTAAATGGAAAATGGAAAATGGTAAGGSGGAMGTGGVGTGGAGTGGLGVGGTGAGGAATGGEPGIGGTPGTGGTGAGSGGSTGGSATCDTSPPPENVADWVQESWDAQLGDNIESRQAWLLDSVMKGEGQINLCIRWGATSAPSATVKSQLASSVQSWFNDWFKALGDYDCFPYGDGITAKITGWAVKPGNTGWVSDLGPDVKIYTETDGEGEPKCPDACSFFSNWDHEFPNCAGGEAFHTDYWIWVDDQLPGGGGAAAVGGDWGLRMPVGAFVSALGKAGSNVIEHEIGHGFGFQDYYDWTGSTPEGGSLMIVGSQGGGTPTLGDTWLLRRTWSEMRTLRGW
jgi:hypothetical protein